MRILHRKNLLKPFGLAVPFLFFVLSTTAQHPDSATIIDESHYSNVFGELRHYRVFLPPTYFSSPDKNFPVVYFYHGWSQRYFGSSDPYGDFDKGNDNGGDNIANFVAKHDVIVVKPDGYNRSRDEEYYVRPYNVTPVETHRQFPVYFPELVRHIDEQYRTIADREHRGITGLSMGGFMTFWIAGKYPHLLSAAGSFCGSPEFTAGPKTFPVEYRHIDMYKNYGGLNVRLHYGDKDFIRGYHHDLNRVWTQVMDNYSYKIFDAAHSTAGLGEMLSFILKTFDNPPPRPAQWHHADAYPEFDVWDYRVITDRAQPGFTMLENVDARGFRSAVREHLPDGTLLASVNVAVKTPAIYEKDQSYVIHAINTTTRDTSQVKIKSDAEGRLIIHLDGGSHEVGINKLFDTPNLAITSVTTPRRNWATHDEKVSVDILLLNKGMSPARNVRTSVTATRPGTEVFNENRILEEIPVNGSEKISFAFRTYDNNVEIVRFKLTFRDDKGREWMDYAAIPLKKKVAEIKDFEIADGRMVTVVDAAVRSDTLFLGQGNGDGVANPGESLVILVRDGGKLWRTDITTHDPYINPFGINIRKSDNWSSFDHVGASAKYDIPVIASDCPEGHPVEVFVEYWQPDRPLHIIRQGVINFTVKGKDTTAPSVDRVHVAGNNVIQVSLVDGGEIRNVTATLTDAKDSRRVVRTIMRDDGKQGDGVANDRIFSKEIPSQVFGLFKVVVESEDSFGNKGYYEPKETFVVH